MDKIKCFLIEPTDRDRLALRRYSSGNACPLMPGDYSYHDESVPIGEVPFSDTAHDKDKYEGDPCWPTKCKCGYEFTDKDEKQVFSERVYKRQDTGEETTLRSDRKSVV